MINNCKKEEEESMLAVPFVILALVIIGVIWFVVYKLKQKKK
jgi:hypothetical protein